MECFLVLKRTQNYQNHRTGNYKIKSSKYYYRWVSSKDVGRMYSLWCQFSICLTVKGDDKQIMAHKKIQYMFFQQTLVRVCYMFKEFMTDTSRISVLEWHSDATFKGSHVWWNLKAAGTNVNQYMTLISLALWTEFM